MFLSGINHVFYHGTCYSPDDAGWPGWAFYASYEMNPRNSIWRDVPALNGYAARCQAVLQSGRSDNDILLYWPIHELWHNPAGMVQPLTVHAREWFEGQSIGKAAERLWNRGYAFDYISDRQLATAQERRGKIAVPGGDYRAVVVPQTGHMPVDTLRKLFGLAKSGATIIFETKLPRDVPGWARLDQRRAELKKLCAEVKLPASTPGTVAAPDAAIAPGPNMSSLDAPTSARAAGAKLGKGRILVGDIEPALESAGIPREPMFEHPGLMCVRRGFEGGHYYFVANRSEQTAVKDWVALTFPGRSVEIMDPLSGRSGMAALRRNDSGSQVYLQLQPGASVLLRCSEAPDLQEPAWTYWEPCGNPIPLAGAWQGSFLQGGPEFPAPFQTRELASWTELADTNAQRFAGTAVYRLTFDAPKPGAGHWRLELGKVCQSARVRLNGTDLGTLIIPPFSAVVGPLKPNDNLLEVEVTNSAANRIRDLDRRGVKWKAFYDINVVGLDYKPFDASRWPLRDSGLMGPVTLTPIIASRPEENRGS